MNETIIVQAQRGDAQAFQQIVEEYHAVAWRTARILLRDVSLTEDVLQEAWIDAWQGLPRLRHHQTLRAWLLTIVANRCRMTLRRSAIPTVSLGHDPDTLLLASEIEDAFAHIVRLEGSRDLREALATLTEDQRRILELRYFADLELSEIASVTSLPLGTIKSRQHRALQHLRNRLSSRKKEKLFL